MRKLILCGLIIVSLTNLKCQDDGHEQFESVSRDPVNGIRIAWDYSSLKQLSPADANYSGYARMIRLADNRLMCVYESDGKIQMITSQDAQAWSTPATLAIPDNGIPCYVPDIIQLKDGSILVMYNMRPGNNTDPSKAFSIRVKRSTDAGQTWSNHTEIYRAGFEFHNGCWEPSAIQLASGEVQLFIANEGPYINSNEQEITMLRSMNNGESWTNGEKVSFRPNYRDGMPVPLVLQNDEIVFAIEDNGIAPPEFKPVIIRAANDNWTNAPVLASSPDRELAFSEHASIGGSLYAGAPYIRQLKSGETILSYQGNERKPQNPWDRSDMIVCIGDETARGFNRKSTPFYSADGSKTALWNSVTIESDTSVIALTSTNIYSSKVGVWMIRGYVQKEPEATKQSLTINDLNNEQLWQQKPQVFIGGYGSTHADINFSWDDDNLYAIAAITDENVFHSSDDPAKDDGLEILLDPRQKSTADPVQEIYSVHVTAGGKLTLREGKDGIWAAWNASDVRVSTNLVDDGYRIELAIPWAQLKINPVTQSKVRFHVILHESKTGGKIEYKEPIAGNIDHAPYTWSVLNFE